MAASSTGVCESAAVASENTAAFSELIGNTDRHFENISLLTGEDGEYLGVAPAYDILPMRYACLGGGLDPDLSPIEPKVGTIGAKPAVWARASEAAERFWTRVHTERHGWQRPSDEITRQMAKLVCVGE